MKLLILITILQYAICQEFPVITTPLGDVQGMSKVSRLDGNVTFYSFLGIPYAEAPVGALRFKEPVPVAPWTGTHNGTKTGMACPQFLDIFYLGEEDCLNLDVHIKELPTGGPLKPVMFWIYGGAYEFGANAIYGPDVLVKEDVCLVVINYRLGIFGFLSTGDQNAWGNQALKDQVVALQWVRDNAMSFGCDPNMVTVFGESAGASSGSYLQLSSTATGLFHRIMQNSGCAINSWAVQRNPMPYIANLTSFFGISSDSTDSIVTGLQGIDAKTLYTAARNPNVTGHYDPLKVPPFFPVIEPAHPTAFITQAGIQQFMTGDYTHLPFFKGHTTTEGSYGLGYLLSYYTFEDFDIHPDYFVSPSFNNPDSPFTVGAIIRDNFLNGTPAAANEAGVLKLLTQEFFVRGMRKEIDLLRSHGDEGYFYRFSYEASALTGYPGVDHSEDLQYYWYMPNADYTTYTAADFLTQERTSKLWANFAKFGNPTPIADPLFNNLMYPKVTATEVGFVDIGADLVPGTSPNQTEYDFWNNLFAQYAKFPLVTY